MNTFGTIQISNRDRLFMVVLPALAVFIGYSYVITKKPNVRIKQLTAQLEASTAAQPHQEEVHQQRAAQAAGTRRLNQARVEREPLRHAIHQHLDGWQHQRARLQANDDLASLWRRHGLTLLEQTQVPSKDLRIAPLVQRLQQQTRTLLQREFAPVLWEVRLEGGFYGIKRALEEIHAGNLPVIPASLDMHLKPRATTKIWTLQLWQ